MADVMQNNDGFKRPSMPLTVVGKYKIYFLYSDFEPDSIDYTSCILSLCVRIIWFSLGFLLVKGGKLRGMAVIMELTTRVKYVYSDLNNLFSMNLRTKKAALGSCFKWETAVHSAYVTVDGTYIAP